MAAEDAWGGHRDMLHDKDRNELYALAIENAVERIQNLTAADRVQFGHGENADDSSVAALDIGTGTSLLACFAARAGARVTAFEVLPQLAHLAAGVVRDNGFSATIQIMGMHSTDARRDPRGRGWVVEETRRVLPAASVLAHSGRAPTSVLPPADLLVHELLDTRLIGEGLVPALRHAWAEGLLRPGAACVPSRATVFAQPVSCAYLRHAAGLRPDAVWFPFTVPEAVKRCRGSGCLELNCAVLVGHVSTALMRPRQSPAHPHPSGRRGCAPPPPTPSPELRLAGVAFAHLPRPNAMHSHKSTL